MSAPDRIWARPIGATLDWTGAASGPWALDDPHKTGTVFLASTPARENAVELVEAVRSMGDALEHALSQLPDDANQILGMKGALRRGAIILSISDT